MGGKFQGGQLYRQLLLEKIPEDRAKYSIQHFRGIIVEGWQAR